MQNPISVFCKIRIISQIKSGFTGAPINGAAIFDVLTYWITLITSAKVSFKLKITYMD